MACDAHAITSLAALEALVPEWDALWARAEGTPFQSSAWLLPWWKHVGDGDLAAVALRECDAGRLVGFAPLYVYRHPKTRVRHLFPLGIATTDRLDMLVEPAWEATALRAIAQHLARTRDAWDVFEAPQLHEQAAWLRVPWPDGWSHEIGPAEPNPIVALPANLSADYTKRLRYCRHRAEREGGLVSECAEDARHARALLDTLADLHARRWSERGEAGVLGGRGVLAWHREATPRLLHAGLLRLIALRFEGEPMAVLYCLMDGTHVAKRCWYDYIGGFDPPRAIYSPGSLIVAESLARATAEGAQVCDFLRGGESYKYRWGAVDRPMFTLRVRA